MFRRFLLLSLVIIAGCSNSQQNRDHSADDSAEFLGKWVDTLNVRHTITIERAGEGLLIREQAPNMFLDAAIANRNSPATVKDHTMTMVVDGGNGLLARFGRVEPLNLNFVIDKKTGRLTSKAADFVRSTPALQKEADAEQRAAETRSSRAE